MGADMGISEISNITGLSQDTLRWYERQGIIPAITRSSDGRRCYSETDARIIQLIVRLRRTGMPLADIRRFRNLLIGGAATHGRRMALLQKHKKHLEAHISELQQDLRNLNDKIAHYQRLIELQLDCSEQPITDPKTLQEQRRTDI
ncbi:HTH-type transcriptional regulator AdhR [Corynebacterium freiburgense]|nr:HTH-type transcriptional regulator AdhR [Corynebacterium freiburgense]